MSCAFFEVHAAPERRGSDYCGNKRRAPPEGFLRRRENCAQRETPSCRSRAGNRLLWPASQALASLKGTTKMLMEIRGT
jgi:hypothetical protein